MDESSEQQSIQPDPVELTRYSTPITANDLDDEISEMSGKLTTSTGSSKTDSLHGTHQQAHELRLNLIYSGSLLLGMIFLVLHTFLFFLIYPSIVFILLHIALELRHDMAHKTRYFAHMRYTQASLHDRSYGGDLYLANLVQSWLVFTGGLLFLGAVHTRAHLSDFTTYKIMYFCAALFFFLSGATTMLSRGCGNFYYMGRSPGFSTKDQTANVLYVTSTVLLLIIASWQIDRGVFDTPLVLAENFIFLMWLVAAVYYTAADVTRLRTDNTGNSKGAADAFTSSDGADDYVQMENGSKSRDRHAVSPSTVADTEASTQAEGAYVAPSTPYTSIYTQAVSDFLNPNLNDSTQASVGASTNVGEESVRSMATSTQASSHMPPTPKSRQSSDKNESRSIHSADTNSTTPYLKAAKTQSEWGWSVPTVQNASLQMSNFVGTLMTPTKPSTEQDGTAEEASTTALDPAATDDLPAGAERKGVLGGLPFGRKTSKKHKTKFYNADGQLV
jgi:hypothetical protein